MKTKNYQDIKALFGALKDKTLVGYVWMSDAQEPHKLESQSVDTSWIEKSNPFIIEAQLYDGENGMSYSVRYVGGQHIITETEIVLEDTTFTRHEYICSFDDSKKMKMLQYWEAQPDPLCEGMEVLQPTANVFIGFTDNNEKEEEKV